jgi:mono/diheme cytochrome c family protein
VLIRTLLGAAAVVLIAASSVPAADGAAIYQQQCAKCHGDTGKADTTIGKAMKVPPIVGDANIEKMSESDVAARIKENTKHPPTIKSLSAEDVDAAAAYVKQLAGGK